MYTRNVFPTERSVCVCMCARACMRTCLRACDKYVNNYRHRLVQFCRNMDIHIVNGRVDRDRYIGSLTVDILIDYFIVSSQVFPYIYDFLLTLLMHCCLIVIEHSVLNFVLLQNNLTQVIFLVLSRMVPT